MPVCCFPLFRGSRPKKVQNEKSFCCFRRWCKRRHHQRLPPPGKIHSQKSIQDITELADGFTYTINGHSGPVHRTRNTVQCRSENSSDDIIEELVHETHYKVYRVKVQVHQTDTTIQQMSQILNEDILEEFVNGFTYSTALDKGKVLQSTDTRTCCTEGRAEISFQLREACRMRTLQGGAVKKLAEFLTPAVLGGNISHLSTFRTMHSYFSQSPMLLDGDLLCRAMASTVGTWPYQVQGFGTPLRLSFFHLKQSFVQVNVSASHQLFRAHLLCVDLEYPEPQDATPEVPPTELGCTAQIQKGSAQGLAPFSAMGLALARLGRRQYQKPGGRHLCIKHILGELLNDFDYSTSLNMWKMHEACDTRQFHSEGRAEFSFQLREACRMRTLQGGAVKKLAEFLTPAVLGGNISHLATFRTMHSYFSQSPMLLDGDLLCRAMASTVGTWPYQVQGFGTPLRLSLFHLKQSFVQVNVSASHQLFRAHLLCVDLEYPEPQDATPEVPPTELGCTAQIQKGSAQGLAPFSAMGLALARLGRRQYQKPGGRHLCIKHILGELLNDFDYSTSLNKWKMHEACDTRQFHSEGRAEFSFQLREACRMRTLQGGAVKKLAEFLTPAVLGGNISHLSTFRTMHSYFSQSPMLLDGDLLCRAMASTVGTWPYQVQGFGTPLRLSLFHLKQSFVQVNVSASHQLFRAHLLCVDLEYPEPQDATPEVPPTELGCTAQIQKGSAQGLAPFSAMGLALARLGRRQYQKPGGRHLCIKHILGELLNDFDYSTSLNKWKMHEACDTRQFHSEGRAEFSFQLREACRMRTLQGGAVKKLAEFLTPAVLGGNISHLSTFRTMHSYFSQSPMLLDGDLLCRAMASTVGTWPYQVQGFGTPLRLSLFHLKQSFVQVNVSASHQLFRAHLLCVDLEYPEPQDATPEVPPTELGCTAQIQKGSAQGLAPFSAMGLALARLGRRQYQKPGGRHLCIKHILGELLNDFDYSTSLNKWKMHEACDTRQFHSEGRAEFSFQLREACRMRTLQGGAVKKLAEFLTPAVLGGNISHLSTFRTMHSYFSQSPMLLDGDLLCRAIASTGRAWLDQVQAFGQPLHLSLFHLKPALVQVDFPTSEQLCEAQLFSVNLDYPEPQGATPEDPLPEFENNAHLQEVHGDWLAPGPARCLTLAWPGLIQCLKSGWRLLSCFCFLALLGILSFILTK